MTAEELAYKMFERNAKTYGSVEDTLKFYWLTTDAVRDFWMAEAQQILDWLAGDDGVEKRD